MKLNILNEDDYFNYDSVANDMWGTKLAEAKKNSGIEFSTENDDDIEDKDIIIKQDYWDSVKCKFKCQLRQAGGDWQIPIYYFRVQLVDGYAYKLSQYSNPYQCIIPDKAGGNHNLVPTKTGKMSAPDNDSPTEHTEPNPKHCWNYLKQCLTDLVQKEIDEIKRGKT